MPSADAQVLSGTDWKQTAVPFVRWFASTARTAHSGRLQAVSKDREAGSKQAATPQATSSQTSSNNQSTSSSPGSPQVGPVPVTVAATHLMYDVCIVFLRLDTFLSHHLSHACSNSSKLAPGASVAAHMPAGGSTNRSHGDVPHDGCTSSGGTKADAPADPTASTSCSSSASSSRNSNHSTCNDESSSSNKVSPTGACTYGSRSSSCTDAAGTAAAPSAGSSLSRVVLQQPA